ncbi:hypothetical protein NDU88_001837 [Pleurodeles waltl]|uniref:Uncharacterized protein n=1 Tax=Pleurodeles waltl TaxID=8319 RepID=A0AAV7T136_PLEWA|nr:hypothetical protein NDU88_001837 [Pleurodeles waltl]
MVKLNAKQRHTQRRRGRKKRIAGTRVIPDAVPKLTIPDIWASKEDMSPRSPAPTTVSVVPSLYLVTKQKNAAKSDYPWSVEGAGNTGELRTAPSGSHGQSTQVTSPNPSLAHLTAPPTQALRATITPPSHTYHAQAENSTTGRSNNC